MEPEAPSLPRSAAVQGNGGNGGNGRALPPVPRVPRPPGADLASCQDPDAERACLGCAMLDPETLPALIAALRPEDFSDSRHDAIFRAMLALHESGKTVELVSLQSALRQAGTLDAAGGPLYLMGLAEAVLGGTSAVLEWAGIVSDHALRRAVIAQMAALPARLIAADDPAAVLEEAAEELKTAGTAQAAARRCPWEAFTGPALFQDIPPSRNIVEEIIPAGGIVMVAGEAGSFKTGLVSALAWAVATDTPWLGLDVEGGPVLWLNADMPKAACQERMAAFGRGGNHSQRGHLLTLYPWLSPPLALDDAHSVRLLIHEAKRTGAVLIVLDCLSKMLGAADENSNSECRTVMHNLRVIAQETGAAVVFIHHTPKASRMGGTGNGRPAGHRGAATIRDLVDGSFLVSREPASDLVTMTPDKVRHAMPRIITARFHHEKTSGPARALRAAWWQAAAPPPDSLAEAEGAILAVLRERGELKTGELERLAVKDSGVPRADIRAARERLARRGGIIMREVERGGRLFHLPAGGEG